VIARGKSSRTAPANDHPETAANVDIGPISYRARCTEAGCKNLRRLLLINAHAGGRPIGPLRGLKRDFCGDRRRRPFRPFANALDGEAYPWEAQFCWSRSSFEERGNSVDPLSEMMTANEMAAFLKVNRDGL
jgi:hypothetical protein